MGRKIFLNAKMPVKFQVSILRAYKLILLPHVSNLV